jgi:tRNA(fMet)-specific endonuclease VapC
MALPNTPSRSYSNWFPQCPLMQMQLYGMAYLPPLCAFVGTMRLIAAHALNLGVALVTNNEADFRDYPGLMENWVIQ